MVSMYFSYQIYHNLSNQDFSNKSRAGLMQNMHIGRSARENCEHLIMYQTLKLSSNSIMWPMQHHLSSKHQSADLVTLSWNHLLSN
jgi:hypothetical protein